MYLKIVEISVDGFDDILRKHVDYVAERFDTTERITVFKQLFDQVIESE